MDGVQKRIRLQSLGATNTGAIINIPKIMSNVNMRYMGHTDEDGNLLAYPYRLVFRPTGVPSETTVADAITTEIPNTWKVRNAFRKWHFARKEMFSRVGVTKSELGSYGRLLRPYMDGNHAAGVYTEVDSFDLGSTGSWNYTKIASNLDWPDDFALLNLVDLDMIDTYNLHVCTGHNVENDVEGVEMYSSVGMVLSYNQDRMEVLTPQLSEAFAKINPLANLVSNDATGGEVSDLALALQTEGTPYDKTDDGDSIRTITTGTGNGRNTGGIFSISGIAPAGYILVTSNLPLQAYLEVGTPILAKDC
jgi:hypothetical protein|eukprot:SAG22_NODE_2557_length_2449_cov_15.699574_3_plen_306_part_00